MYFTSGPAPYNRTLAGGRCTCVEVQSAATHFCMLLWWQFVANFTKIFCHTSYCRRGSCTIWYIPDSRAIGWLGVLAQPAVPVKNHTCPWSGCCVLLCTLQQACGALALWVSCFACCINSLGLQQSSYGCVAVHLCVATPHRGDYHLLACCSVTAVVRVSEGGAIDCC